MLTRKGRTRPAPIIPLITLGRVTPTIPHLAKAIGLLYLYLVGLMVIVRVSYTRGSGGVDQ